MASSASQIVNDLFAGRKAKEKEKEEKRAAEDDASRKAFNDVIREMRQLGEGPTIN